MILKCSLMILKCFVNNFEKLFNAFEMSEAEKCLYENLLYLYHTKLPRQKSSRHPKINPTLPQINPTTPQINPTTPQNKSYVTPLHPEYFTNSSRIHHQSSRIHHQSSRMHHSVNSDNSGQFWLILSVP